MNTTATTYEPTLGSQTLRAMYATHGMEVVDGKHPVYIGGTDLVKSLTNLVTSAPDPNRVGDALDYHVLRDGSAYTLYSGNGSWAVFIVRNGTPIDMEQYVAWL